MAPTKGSCLFQNLYFICLWPSIQIPLPCTRLHVMHTSWTHLVINVTTSVESSWNGSAELTPPFPELSGNFALIPVKPEFALFLNYEHVGGIVSHLDISHLSSVFYLMVITNRYSSILFSILHFPNDTLMFKWKSYTWRYYQRIFEKNPTLNQSKLTLRVTQADIFSEAPLTKCLITLQLPTHSAEAPRLCLEDYW